MVYDPYDFEIELDANPLEEINVAPERSTFSDFFHGLWSGIGETADIFGRGTGIETLKDIGEYIGETSYAKPDVSEYLGVQTQSSKTATGVGQGLPLSATFMAGGAAGGLAGSVVGPAGTVAGGVAGTTAVGAAFARGLYDKTVEDMTLQHPDWTPEEIDNYSKKIVAIETLTEMVDAGVSLVAGKIAGKMTGSAVKTALSNGILSVDDIIGASAKRMGAKQFLGAAFGDAAVSGGSEVLADKLQYELDKSYDIDAEDPDYFTTFMVGALMSAPFGAASAYMEKGTQEKIRANIEKGLTSEDETQRLYTAKQISDNLGKVSPEAKTLWDDYVELNGTKGPISIDDPKLILSTSAIDKMKSDQNIANLEAAGRINRLDVLRRDSAGASYSEIITKPESILETAGIPSGTATPPGGKGIAPPGVSAEAAPTVPSPKEPQWYKKLPLSLRETNALMDEQVAAYQEEGETPPSKIAEVPTRETKAVKAEPERKATELEAQWKKPIYENPQKIAEAMAELPEDSNTLTVEQQQKIEATKKAETANPLLEKLKEKGTLTLAERKQLVDATGKEYKVLQAEAKEAERAEKAKAKAAEQVTLKEVDKKLEAKATALKSTLEDTTATEAEKAKAKVQLEKVQTKIAEETSKGVVESGPISGVDVTGKETKVTYDPKGWKKATIKGVTVHTNKNAIVYKIDKKDAAGNQLYKLAQKDESGQRVVHPGTYKSRKAAFEALAEGRLPEVTKTKAEKKAEAPKITLSEKGKETLGTIDPVKVANKAVAMEGSGDKSTFSGHAMEGVIEAANTFDSTKTSKKFEDYALNKARDFVKRAKAEIASRKEVAGEIQTGEESTTNLADTTAATKLSEVGEVAQEGETRKGKAEVKKEEKQEAPPAKSLKEVLDKHNVPKENRNQYFLDVADNKKTIESIDKELTEATKIVAKEETVEEATPTEKPQIKKDTTLEADITYGDRENDPAIANLARDIFEKFEGNLEDATADANEYQDPYVRNSLINALSSMRYVSTNDILGEYLTQDQKNTREYFLASYLKKLIGGKAKHLKILIDPNIRIPKYNFKTNTIYLYTASSRQATSLHELGHAITAREMFESPEIRDEIIQLMEVARDAAVAEGLMTQEQVDMLRSSKLLSPEQAKEMMGNISGTTREIMYGLSNEFEFMAQVMDRPVFMDFLQRTPIPNRIQRAPSFLSKMAKTLYDLVALTFGKIFGPGRGLATQRNIGRRVLELYGELSAVNPVDNRTAEELSMEADITGKEAERTPEDDLRIMQEREVSLKTSPKQWLKQKKDTIKAAISDYLQSTTTRLERISPQLSNALRKMEWKIATKNREYHDKIADFMNGYKKLSDEDQMMLDLALMNSDGENRYEKVKQDILSKAGLTEAFAKVEEVLQDIYRRKDAQGLNKYESVPKYFPRRPKDIDKLRQAMKDDGSYGVIQAQIDRKDMSETDKEVAITSLINTGRMPPLAFRDPTSSKQRKIAVVPAEWKVHYEDSISALINHIYESNEAIESRAMIGGSKRKEMAQLRDEAYAALASITPPTETKKSPKFEAKVAEIQSLEEWLDRNKEEEFDSQNVREYLKENAIHLLPEQQHDVIKLLRGRLTQSGMSGIWADIRNISLLSVLGNPLSAVTQTADIAFVLSDAPGGLFADRRITAKSLDLEHSMREFAQTGRTTKWLDWALRKSGMTLFDRFGKEVYMNAVIDKASKMTEAEFTEKWGKYLEKDAAQTYEDIKNKKDTELVSFFAFNALSEQQPISLSEMPLKYLLAKNGRIAYALKSYNIRLINNIYKRAVYGWKDAKTNKEKAKALADASKLVALVALAGATADELKDLIQGKDNLSLSERVSDNLLKIVFMNKFALSKASREGFFTSVVGGNIMPPLQVFNDPIRDVTNLFSSEKEASFYTLRNVPVVGKLGYEWFSNTSERTYYPTLKTHILEDIMEGESYSSSRGKINKYNQWARKNKQPLITFSTINRAKRRAREKERENE